MVNHYPGIKFSGYAPAKISFLLLMYENNSVICPFISSEAMKHQWKKTKKVTVLSLLDDAAKTLKGIVKDYLTSFLPLHGLSY